MANKIKHLRSSTPEKVPTGGQIDVGQFAINSNDGKVFIKKDDGTVKDITNNIFKNDTSIVVTDSPASDTGAITATVDSVNTLTLKKTQTELKEKVFIQNEKELRFYEATGSGTDYVSIKAPTNLAGTYNLTLPLSAATSPGQVLGVNAGQLAWYDADSFGGNRIYVSAAKGNDTNDGINAPVKTIKRALQIASGYVYDSFGVPNGARWNVSVAAGEYYEANPIIVPDNVSVIGDGLRACILRPLNARKDMLRVRNGCYFTEFTFRDALTGAPSAPSPIGSPIYTFDYAVAFDDPLDATVSRLGYTNLPSTKPLITTSPYIQNCSIISFLGGNGVLVDGNKVVAPNTPQNQIESENPVSGPAPEQGKSMVANAFTMLSFGGTGWRVINDAYVQIVSCFQIFMLNGTYTQSGGYCSITNSATNFGLYALRASGFSPNAFAFDKGYVATTGVNDSKQTLTAFGFTRPNGPVEEFVVRIYDPNTNADLTDNTYKLTTAGFAEKTFNAATAVTVANPGIFTITAHGFNNGDQVTYFNNSGTTIGGLFNGDTYFVQVIDANSFTLAFDDSFTRQVQVTSAGSGTQKFKRNDYEMIIDNLLESHNTFQTLTLASSATSFSPGDLVTGDDTAPPGYPNSGYVYSWNSTTRELVVVVNKVTVGINEQRVTFNSTSRITAKNGVTLGSPISLTGVAGRTDLWAATFEVVPSTTGGQFTGLASLPGKKVWFHRPSITNSSAHTWEYAGSGTDYNALPQNGGKTIEKYEQYSELAGKVYTSGTNELGDFKVGNFIRAYNRTGNVTFSNKVSIDQLDVLRLGLGDVQITELSIDPNLGEGEVDGPLNTRLSTQKAIWSYANNRLGPFIDKSVSTNAVPGNIVQLNANGQINRDLIPSQRNFSSFTTLGFGSRVTLSDDIPVNDSQSGDICTERYEQVALTLTNPVTVTEGWLVTQAGTGATGYIKETVTSSSTIVVASIYGTFETPNFNTVGALTINGNATPSDTNTTVIPTVVGGVVPNSSNYFISNSNSSQYLIVGNTATFTYTNVAVSTAVRYNNVAYVQSATHSLVSGNRIQLNLTDDDFDVVGYTTVFDTTRFSLPNTGTNTASTGSTTATATIVGVTGTSTTGSISSAGLTGSISVGDWVFGGGLPLGSRITAANMAVNPRTFTVTFPSSTTVAGTTTASLVFISPVARTGTVKSVVTAADSGSNGAFDKVKSGVLTRVNNLTFTKGSGYTPASGTKIYLRVPLTNISGTGTGATANITVANGNVTDVDIFRGGTGYKVGDVLSASSANIGGTGSGFQITVTGVEQRIYVDIIGGVLFVATSGAIDFVEDNNSPSSTIISTDSTTKSFNSLPIASGGNVDYTLNQITITGHGFSNGDPVKYDSSPNLAMGDLIAGNVYYVKSINANTIELYKDYNLATKATFGTSSTGTHNLIRYAVNLIDNSFYVPAHGFLTGEAIRMTGSNLPSYLVSTVTTQIADNSYFFVGSVTTNSFTLHELRSDALASINGVVSVAYDINITGTGSIKFVKNNITSIGVVNTSSQYTNNWSVLVTGNIDASNIVSGIISTSRLGLGSSNTNTFLRGDNSWKTAVQTLEYTDSAATNNYGTSSLLTLTGTVNGTYTTNDRSGVITVNVQRANQQSSQDYSTMGVASFKKTHFVVGSSATTLGATPTPITGLINGQVYIRPSNQGGDVDAATLETRNLAYVLDSNNHTIQPVNKGGTNITTYTTGDMIYATGTAVLDKLPIDVANTVMTSTGGAPQWSSGLSLAQNLDVAGGNLTTASTATGSIFNTNAVDVKIGGAANSVTIGSTGASQTLTSNIATYTTGGSSSTSVTANLTGSVTIATSTLTNSGVTQIDLANTTGVKVGQLLSGSGSLAVNTQVVGISATRVYISAATVGSISASTNLTFTETNTSLGLKVGDQITIAGETVNTNLNGTWPITNAGASTSTFTFKINTAVTLTNAARTGTAVKDTSLLIRNRNVVIGSTEASATPVAAAIRAENAVGTNLGGAALTLRGGLSTGAGTGGVINFATGTTGTTGDIQQAAVTRMTLAESAAATTLDLTTAMTTANVFNANATTGNLFGAATTISIGATTGTATINNPTLVGTQTTQNLYNTVATTLNFAGAATSLNIGAATGTLTIGNSTITGTNATSFNMNGASPSIVTSSTGTVSVFNTNALTANAFGAATTVNIGNNSAAQTVNIGNASTGASTYNLGTGVTAAATTKIVNVGTGGNVGSTTNINIGSSNGGTTTINSPEFVVSGNLTVNGNTTVINTTTLQVNDANIEIGKVASPTDVTANGGGITLLGATNKTITWLSGTGRWTFNQPVEATSIQNTPIGGTTASTGVFTTLSANSTATFTGAITANTTTNNQSYTTSGAGTITITSGTTGSINNMSIGATTASTGAFTTLSASSTVSGAGFTNYFASPPSIGSTTANTGAFTSLSATGAVTANTTTNNQSYTTSGAGTITITSGTTGNINNMNIGATTRGSGSFTTLTANGAVTLTSGTNSTTATSGTLVVTGGVGISQNLNVGGTLNITTTWKRVTTTYTALPGDKIIADTSGGVFTVTLPAAPITGTSVHFADGDDWSKNVLTVSRNGQTIEGLAEDLTINISGVQVELIFDGTTWEVYALTNASSTGLSNDNTTNATVYPLWAQNVSGLLIQSNVSSSKLTFNPSTGVFSATDINSLSDERLKENVTPILNSLSLIEKINPVSFNWKDTGKKANGVLAQEIEQLLPEIVETNTDTGMKSVSYTQIVPFLVQAIKELKAEIELLKTKE